MKIHEFIIVAVVMWIIAFMFVKGWDMQEAIDQVKRASHMDTLLYPDPPPAAPTGVRPNYGESSEPRKHHYQDASVRRKE